MIRVGITGNTGCLGMTLAARIRGNRETNLIAFERSWFNEPEMLQHFVAHCDWIIHFAAISRDGDGERLYQTNMRLLEQLLAAVTTTQFSGVVALASTTRYAGKLPYHKSKRDGAALLLKTATENAFRSSVLLFENAFAPGVLPDYNSVVSTFCANIAAGIECKIDSDAQLTLLSAAEQMDQLMEKILAGNIPVTMTFKGAVHLSVSELKEKLEIMRTAILNKQIPRFETRFEYELYTTLRAYCAGLAD